MNNADGFNSYFAAHLRVSKMKNIDEVQLQIRECPNPFFTLTDVSFEEFEKDYQADHILLNKLKSPYAFINFLQGIYHLAVGILFQSEVTFGTAIRDFQEGYGRLVRVVNDAKGNYYIERSLFHKSAYEYYAGLSPHDISAFPHRTEAARWTLLDLKKNPSAIIARFELNEIIDKLGKEAFLEKIDNLDVELLSNISIEDFIRDADDILSHFLISNKELAALPLEEVAKIGREHNQRFVTRLNAFKKPDSQEGDSVTLLKIMTTAKAQDLLDKLPPHLYHLFSDEQILEIDFTDLTPFQISWLVNRQNAKSKEIFAKIPNDKIESLYGHCYSSFIHISDEQLKHLKNPPVGVLRDIFPQYDQKADDKRRFTLIPGAELQLALPHFDHHLRSLISDDQLKELDLSKLDEHQRILLFHSNLEETPRRVRALKPAQIESFGDNAPISVLQHITNDQIRALDYKKMSVRSVLQIFQYILKERTQERIGLLSPTQIVDVLPHFNGAHCQLISDDQIRGLPFSEMDVYGFKKIFDVRFGPEATRRFELIPVKTVQSILDKLDTSLALIPDDYLKELDLSSLDGPALDMLLTKGPIYGKDRVNLLSKEQIEQILPNISDAVGLRLTSDQVKEIDLSKLEQLKKYSAVNYKTLPLIADSQLEYLLTLSKVELDPSLFTHLSIEQVKKYVDKFNDDQINWVFHLGANAHNKMAALTPVQANALFGRPIRLGNLISKAQLVELDLSNRSKDSISKFINELEEDFVHSMGLSRFHELSAKQIQDILPNLLAVDYITESQYKQIDFSILSKDTINNLICLRTCKNWITKAQLVALAAQGENFFFFTKEMLTEVKDRLGLSDDEFNKYQSFCRQES